jgi:hypothetical protein
MQKKNDIKSINARSRFSLDSDKLPGLLLMLASLFFFTFTLTGRWSSGAGIGARLFPQLTLGLMFFSGLVVFRSAGGKEAKEKFKDLDMRLILAFLALAVLFFFAVLHLGLAVGVFLYLLSMFLFQLRERRIFFRAALLPAFGITVFIWALFTYFVRIVLPTPLLF